MTARAGVGNVDPENRRLGIAIVQQVMVAAMATLQEAASDTPWWIAWPWSLLR
jgi:hypothetical protein